MPEADRPLTQQEMNRKELGIDVGIESPPKLPIGQEISPEALTYKIKRKNQK